MANISELNQLAGAEFGRAVIEEVRARLTASRGQWAQLVRLSGGTINRTWLASFAQGRIDNPSFTMLSQLAMFLGVRVTVGECRHFSEIKATYTP